MGFDACCVEPSRTFWVGTSHKNYGGLTVVKVNGAVMSCDCLQISLTVFSKCSPWSVFFHT